MYSYVGNNPVNYIDPTGHQAEPAQELVRSSPFPWMKMLVLAATAIVAAIATPPVGPADYVQFKDDLDRDEALKHLLETDLSPYKEVLEVPSSANAGKRNHLRDCTSELHGEVVAFKDKGGQTPFNHCEEVRNHQLGLDDRIKSLQKKLDYGRETGKIGRLTEQAIESKIGQMRDILEPSVEYFSRINPYGLKPLDVILRGRTFPMGLRLPPWFF